MKTSQPEGERAPEAIAANAAAAPEGARGGRWHRVRFGIATRLTLVVIPLVLLPLGGLAYVWYATWRSRTWSSSRIWTSSVAFVVEYQT